MTEIAAAPCEQFRLIHELPTPLAIVVGRVQFPRRRRRRRRRLRRGDKPGSMETALEAIKVALIRLRAAVEDGDRSLSSGRRSKDGDRRQLTLLLPIVSLVTIASPAA